MKIYFYPCDLGFFSVTVKNDEVIGIDIASDLKDLRCDSNSLISSINEYYDVIQPIVDNLDFGPLKNSGILVYQSGSEFRSKVWEAISEIPAGETRTYQEIANDIGSPKAVRAVGSSCGENKLAIFVPCHRVIGSGKNKYQYKWGSFLKQKLLERETK